jgi:hypothetical protein
MSRYFSLHEGEKSVLYALRYPIKKPEGMAQTSTTWYRENLAGRLIGVEDNPDRRHFAITFFNDVKLWNLPEEAQQYSDYFPQEEFDLLAIMVDVKLLRPKKHIVINIQEALERSHHHF